MDLINSFILAVIEGITEFLPISSTGHLIIVSKVLNIEQTNFVKSFEIAIQSGAILAVVFLYWREILENKKVFRNTLYAFVPTALVGFLLYKVVKSFFIGNVELTFSMLVLGGFVMIVLEKYFSKTVQQAKIEDLSIKNSLLIGVFQSLSIVPGVSRSAATILSGIGIGLRREEATKFSFMLAIPTMFAATGYDLAKNFFSFNTAQVSVLAVGFIVSFISALLAVKWFIAFVKNNTLISFGIYRIIAGILFYLFLQY